MPKLPLLPATQTPVVKNPYSHRVKVDQIGVHTERLGNGEHVVLLMPGDWGTPRTGYSKQFQGMDRSKFTLLTFDPVGYKYTRPPERDFENFFRKDAELAAQLMKVLGIEKYSVLGSGDGGTTGMILAAAYPDNVKKLVIWGTKAYVTDDDRELLNIKRGEWNCEANQVYSPIYVKQKWETLTNKYIDTMIQFEDICKDDLKNIQCPTLLLHGENDSNNMKGHNEFLSKNIKNIETFQFKEGGHDIHHNYVQKFNKIVKDFLIKE